MIRSPLGSPRGTAGAGVWTQLWRGVVAYRIAALAYAVALTLGVRDDFAHPEAALGVLAAMAAWTVAVTLANSNERGRVWPVVVADHAVCAVLTLASIPVQGSAEIASGAPTLTTAWAAAPVLSSALLGGPGGGLAGALVQGAASVAVRGALPLATLGNVVLLLLAGGVGGYVARLAVARRGRPGRRSGWRRRPGSGSGWPAASTTACCRCWRWSGAAGAELGGEAAELAGWPASRRWRCGRWSPRPRPTAAPGRARRPARACSRRTLGAR